MNHIDMDELVLRAIKEDMALGDITTDSLIPAESSSRAVFLSKDDGIVAGLDVAERTFKIMDEKVVFERLVQDGARVKEGDIIAEVFGNSQALLKAERTALNFLQHLSGIATMTSLYCEKVKEYPVRIADTRKTTPGLRFLEKYAVRAGGGSNHRYSLSDGVLIKDNHIKAAGGIRQAVEAARRHVPHTAKIEVETETLQQVQEALDSKADIIMLDNMTPDVMRKAVKLIDGRALTEASGNVSLDTVQTIAAVGVDIISVGKLTHSVKAFDISMKFL